MKKKRKRNPENLSEGSFQKYKDENPDKKHPNPDDPQEETGSPLKKMPITSDPHREEILD